jgi:glutamate---cysteine ligase / carboxylate-amine ligase
MSKPTFTLGVEEEYMVVNPETRELSSHDQKIVEHASRLLDDQVKAEPASVRMLLKREPTYLI